MSSRTVLAVCVALSLAGAAGWRHLRADRERSAAHARELAGLRDAVAAADAERARQAEKIARLEAALAATSAAVPAAQAGEAPPAPPRQGAAASGDETAADTPTGPSVTDLGAAMAGSPIGSFDPDRLVAAGFHRQDVERFRARLDEIEMKRLYLRDQAAREGWMNTPRFLEESRALLGELAGLRAEFDDPLYDWMLYSTGHPNRVAVHDVLSGSAGESAGLLRGDLIVRYDDQLVLSAGDLRQATIEGRPGEWVAVEVQRAGETTPRRILVPRGPIGVTLAPATVEPPPAG